MSTRRYIIADRRQRHYKHVLESTLDVQLARGVPFADALRRAKRIADATWTARREMPR